MIATSRTYAILSLIAAALPGCHTHALPTTSDDAGPTGEDAAGVPANPEDGGVAANASACARKFGSGAVSKWVYYGTDGRLLYRPLDAEGDRIADFSSAGYRGGGVALPDVPVAATVKPSGGDDTQAIQLALDAVAKLPANADGVRGAVLLAPGSFTVAGTLTIGTGGVVLRGSGSGSGDTVVHVPGAGQRFLTIQGSGTRTVLATPKATLTDLYVPSGTRSFAVDDPSGFAVGDAVVVQRPVTQPWVHFMGMDALVRDGMPQTWIKVGAVKSFERRIVAIDGKRVSVDIPLTDSFDARYVTPPGGSLHKMTFPGRIAEVGFEHLRVVAPPRSATATADLVLVDAVADGWIRDVVAVNFTEGITIASGAKRITIDGCQLTHDADSYFTKWGPFDISIDATQTLVLRSSSTGGNKMWYYATHEEQGPNVVLDFVGKGLESHLAPHERWSTGLLVDRSQVDSILLYNQGTTGTGHGWAIGWGVAWNCSADTNIEAPPGSMNWAIGCSGTITHQPDDGLYDSEGQSVQPSSLYLAQLCERLGPAALAAIGY
jgi:hypothetical protein